MKLSDRNRTVRELLAPLASRDPGARDRADRVVVYSVAVGERLGMSLGQLRSLRFAAYLHEVFEPSIPRRYRFLAEARRLIRQLHETPSENEEDLGAVIITTVVAFDRAKADIETAEGSTFDDRIIEALTEVSKLIQPVDGP